MSIPVDLTVLQAQITTLGSSALLVTTSLEATPHITSVRVTFAGDNLTMGAGRKTSTNAIAHPVVSLVWPAASGADYCLIVDGVVDEPPTDTLLVRPTSAILHRLAHASADLPRCVAIEDAAGAARESTGP